MCEACECAYLLLDEVAGVHGGKEVFAPRCKVGVNVIIVVAVAAAHELPGAELHERGLEALAHGAKVLVLLVAEAKHAKVQVLQRGLGVPVFDGLRALHQVVVQGGGVVGRLAVAIGGGDEEEQLLLGQAGWGVECFHVQHLKVHAVPVSLAQMRA